MIFPLYLINCNNYKQEYIPLGYVPSAAVVVSGKGSLPGGCLRGGCTPLGQAPLCGQTDACENLTFPQLLLRTVMIHVNWETLNEIAKLNSFQKRNYFSIFSPFHLHVQCRYHTMFSQFSIFIFQEVNQKRD